MDARDAILYSACPLLTAPTLGEFEPLTTPGKRLIAARDGLYLEARSPALHWLLRVSSIPMPYGPISPFIRLANGAVKRTVLFDIADRSLRASPAEIAFGILTAERGYQLLEPELVSASPGHVTYHDNLDANRLVLDVHSHGRGDAYFSGTDNASDLSRNGPYLAAVIAPRASYADTRMTFRAVCAPYLIPLDWDDPVMQEVFE